MNYHYIEVMVMERQKLKLEESERKRMLRMAREQSGDSQNINETSGITIPEFAHPETSRK